MLSFDYKRTSNVFADVNVGVKNHNFKFPLILDKNNIIRYNDTKAKIKI